MIQADCRLRVGKRVASEARNSVVIHFFDLAKCFNRYEHRLKNAGFLPCFATSHPFSSPQLLFLLAAKSKYVKGNRFTKITILHVSQPVFMVSRSIACALGTHHFGYQRDLIRRLMGVLSSNVCPSLCFESLFPCTIKVAIHFCATATQYPQWVIISERNYGFTLTSSVTDA